MSSKKRDKEMIINNIFSSGSNLTIFYFLLIISRYSMGKVLKLSRALNPKEVWPYSMVFFYKRVIVN